MICTMPPLNTNTAAHLAIRASRQPYGYVDETIILPITAYEVRRPRRQQP